MFRIRRMTAFLSVLGLGAFLSGCFDGDSGVATPSDESTTADEEALQTMILGEIAEYADTDVRYFDDGSDDPPTRAAIDTHRWRRELLELDKHVTIEIDKPDGEPATAAVEITADAVGLLHIWACTDSDLAHIVKDWNDTGTRSLFFQQVPRLDVRPDVRPHRGWKLVALSGVDIASDETTRSIEYVEIEAGGETRQYTNVTDLVRVGNLQKIPLGSEVTVTVRTGEEGNVAYLHVRPRRMRLRMEQADDFTFTVSFRADDAFRRARHLVVDVLSEGTLFDDEEPYDNVAWGIPYVLGRPDDIAGG